jgi:hypothetical protein
VALNAPVTPTQQQHNKNGETHIDGCDFKKPPRLDKGNEAIRRATLTNDEYEALYRAMRTYTAKHNKIADAELRVRKIVRHYILIAANSGLRVGDQPDQRQSQNCLFGPKSFVNL